MSHNSNIETPKVRMNVTKILSQQKSLLNQTENANSLAELKNKVILINQQYVEYMSSGGSATAYERRKVKNNMYKLFQAVESLDFEQNGPKFEFSGDPIPPLSTKTKHVSAELTEEYEPQKISGKTNEIVVLGPESAKSHVYLENLSKSTIYGPKNEEKLPWSVHIKNVKDCRIALCCDGPIILHNVETSVLILQSHQIRIHNMETCRIFASVSNHRVIIEGSKNLTMAGFTGAGLCVPSYAVDDFDWPTSETANPHYKMVSNIENSSVGKDEIEDSAEKLLREWI